MEGKEVAKSQIFYIAFGLWEGSDGSAVLPLSHQARDGVVINIVAKVLQVCCRLERRG